MRYPKPIVQDTGRNRIAVAATSFGVGESPYSDCLEHAVEKLVGRRYSVEIDETVRGDKVPFLADEPATMAKRFEGLYKSDGNDLVMSAAGGELMCEVISHVDFNGLAKAEPKWFMGFSDNTNLTFLLPTLCDVAAVYGPCVTAFGMEPWHRVLEAALRSVGQEERGAYAVSGCHFHQAEKLRSPENPFADYNDTVPNVIGYVNAEKDGGTVFSGRALGGCLDVLGMFPGTEFDGMGAFQEKYGDDGIVWLVEPCELNVLDVRRTLWQLRHAGWFDTAKGFVFGRMGTPGDIDGYGYADAIEDAIGDMGLPIVYDCDLGHVPPSLPFIEGALTDVSAKGDRLTLVQKLV